MMKIRHLGHSCVEIIGKRHILIDPDFIQLPMPAVEFICISHAHKDHIGRIADVPEGIILASPDVCEIASKMGVPTARLRSVVAGERFENIDVLTGFSVVRDPVYYVMSLLFRFRLPDPGGTPLSFYIHDEADVLHIGDAHRFPIELHPDILCLPWRNSPVRSEKYKAAVIAMAEKLTAPYILPIHFDLPRTEADPSEISHRIRSTVLDGGVWFSFQNKNAVMER